MIKWLQRLTVIRVVRCFQVSSVLHICHSLDPPHGPWSSVSKGLQRELAIIFQLGVDRTKNAFEHQLCPSSSMSCSVKIWSLGVLAGLVSMVLPCQHLPCTRGLIPGQPLGDFSPAPDSMWMLKALMASGLSTERVLNTAPKGHPAAYLCALVLP